MTQEIGNNNLIDTWASGGTIVEPDLTKKNTGWTLGEKPPHEFMNFLQNEFGKKINYLNRSGVPGHNVLTPYEIGDCVSSGGFVWQAVSANTNSIPSLANTNWKIVNGDASPTTKGLVELATDAEVQAGTDTERAITPAGISARTATESRTGLIELASQAEIDSGASGNLAVTPSKLRFGFGVSLGANGYIKFPSFLGGLIVQWGRATTASISFPLNFPNALLHLSLTINNFNSTAAAAGQHTAITSESSGGFTVAVEASSLSGTAQLRWIAFGH